VGNAFFFSQKERRKEKRNGGRDEGRKEWREKNVPAISIIIAKA